MSDDENKNTEATPQDAPVKKENGEEQKEEETPTGEVEAEEDIEKKPAE